MPDKTTSPDLCGDTELHCASKPGCAPDSGSGMIANVNGSSDISSVSEPPVPKQAGEAPTAQPGEELERSLRRYGSDVQVGGRRLFVRGAKGPHREDNNEEQTQPGLLMLHGFPTSSHDWLGIWHPLAAHYSLLAPDLLGLGLSEKPHPHQYCVTEQAQLLDVLLALSGRRRWHILAHDLGDSVAQELLARQLENRLSVEIVSVCFLNGGLFPESHRPLLIQRLLASAIGPLLVPLLSRPSFERSIKKICRLPWPAGEMDLAWELLKRERGTRVLPSLLGYIAERGRQRQRWLRAMGEGGVPMRLINGLADPVSGAHMAERYQQLVANADVQSLAGVGHYPQLEAPDAVLRAALEFFAEIDGVGAGPRA